MVERPPRVVPARLLPLPPRRRGPNGERLCRWCGGPVPKGRREWCSDQCVSDYLVRKQPRSAVQKRDGGRCGRCGFDCEDNRLYRLRRRIDRHSEGEWAVRRFLETLLPGAVLRDHMPAWRQFRQQLKDRYWRLLGKPAAPPCHRTSLWDADHIVPVEHGGGSCGLENLMTMCWWCHREKTVAQQRGTLTQNSSPEAGEGTNMAKKKAAQRRSRPTATARRERQELVPGTDDRDPELVRAGEKVLDLRRQRDDLKRPIEIAEHQVLRIMKQKGIDKWVDRESGLRFQLSASLEKVKIRKLKPKAKRDRRRQAEPTPVTTEATAH